MKMPLPRGGPASYRAQSLCVCILSALSRLAGLEQDFEPLVQPVKLECQRQSGEWSSITIAEAKCVSRSAGASPENAGMLAFKRLQ